MEQINIADRIVGKEKPIFIIAEAGVNHNGSIEIAKKLVDAAAETGVDAVKFQTFKSENLVTTGAPRASYQERNLGGNESQLEMLKKLELSYHHFAELKEYCDYKGIIFLSTPHTADAIEFLNDLMPCYKIGSGDLTNLPFLQTIARYGKPIILATGMSTLPEIKEALQTIHNVGNRKVIALHCTTNYPCPLNEVNLKAMKTMQEELDCLIGYSDHTMGLQVPIMAASLGAVCIEKHFTLDKSMKGPDHAASLEPDELREMVTSIRNIHSIHGIPEKKPNNSEQSMIRMIRKSIVAKNDFPEGSIVTKEAITIKRPGTGLPPKYFSWLIGKRLVKPLLKDQLLRWEHIGETQNSKKIVWLSANKLGQELLSETVKQGIEISAIITLNPKAKTVMYDGIDVGKWNEFGIPVYEIEDINCEKELLSQLTPDLVMMCGWRQVINKEILSFPSDGFIGFHPTLLPIGRGPAPIINSVISNFTKSGLTLFHVSEGLDDGDIIGQEHFTIEKNDHAQDIYDKVIEAGKKLVVQYFPLIALGKAQRIPQSENNVLVFEKPSLECNRIDFEKESIEQIYNKIRALSKPYKGAYIERNGKKLRIWRAELEDSS